MPRKKSTETEPKESKERARVRLDADIEEYLKSQSERVISKSATELDGTDLTLIANRLLYEHKLTHYVAKQLPLARLFNWLTSWVSGSDKIISLNSHAKAPALQSAEPEITNDFEFDIELGSQFEELEEVIAS